MVSEFSDGCWVSRRAPTDGCWVSRRARQLKPGKRGKIDEREPTALSELGLDANYWNAHVKGVGSGYWRLVASAEALEAKAAQWKQQWLKGIGYARSLVTG